MSNQQPYGDPQDLSVTGNSIDTYGNRGLISTGGSTNGVQGLGGSGGQGIFVGGGVNQGITGNGGTYTNIPYVTTPWTITQDSTIYNQPYPNSSLRTILGSEASNFIILPSTVVLGHGEKRYTLSELLKEIDDVCYMEFGFEIAIRPEVHAAIIAYMKTGYDFADLGMVEFLKRTLSSSGESTL